MIQKRQIKKSEVEMKRVQKLEVDNEVLKDQLAHKDEVTNLQLQLQVGMKEAEIKQAIDKVQDLLKMCEELQKHCSELEKKEEERYAEYQNVISAYDVTVEANTQRLSMLKEMKLFSWNTKKIGYEKTILKYS